jgi:ferric-dicitrate binding protein FerR (iron transport regulator)
VSNTDPRRNWVLWATGGALIFLFATSVTVYEFHARVSHATHALRLSDGTEALFLGDTKVEPSRSYPQPRELRVDGDAFIRTGSFPTPLLVRTRLLLLTIKSNTALRVTAFSKEDGEQVQVLYGQVQANKSYPSTYSQPDMLGAGEMSMINRTIDLMEKDRFDPAEVQAWRAKLLEHETPAASH